MNASWMFVRTFSSLVNFRLVKQTTRFYCTSPSSTVTFVRRVLFNVPGSDVKKLNKALTLEADVMCLDFEDGVAQNMKEQARVNVSDFIANQTFKCSELIVRINGFDSNHISRDLQVLAPLVGKIHGIQIPKVDSSNHFNFVSSMLRKFGADSQALSQIKYFAAIESAKAVINLREICEYNNSNGFPKLGTLIFASEDYCADTGITRTQGAQELLFARSAVVNHAVAYGLDSIDMVCINYKDPAFLEKEAREGAQLGFNGKQAIHPTQIPIIVEAFRPSPAMVEWANKIIEGNKIHQAKGTGAFELDGLMIDLPIVKRATNILRGADIKA
eukprot:TRINITY_DN2729_c0_g1_i2.p1 TRINITY_DN2729_c0_g1~~TRINITY_DN2729_c0_g1_i2.p1  ORF type:complete len:360 (+),score=59.16 TRINITY_DN2729_c0_g1_i2:92-1081(+)